MLHASEIAVYCYKVLILPCSLYLPVAKSMIMRPFLDYFYDGAMIWTLVHEHYLHKDRCYLAEHKMEKLLPITTLTSEGMKCYWFRGCG